MDVTVKIEMSSRLGIIIRAAQTMQSDVIANNLFHFKKQMEEIEQYSRLVRIDVDYLLDNNETNQPLDSDTKSSGDLE